MKGIFRIIIDYDDEKIINNKVNGVKGLKNILKDVEDKFK